MELSLGEDERELLQQVVSSAFRDLRMEIADTDNAEYRAGLRERRSVLESILFQLDNPPRVNA